MRVCFVAGTLGRGGAEKQLLYMLRALTSQGIESRVLCLTRNEAFESEIRSLGLEVEFVGRSKWRPSRLCHIVGNLQRKPADAVHSAHFFTNLYAATAGRILNIPSIGAIRNDLISEVAANGAFGRWQLSLPGSQVANSELAVKRAIDRGYSPEKIFLVRNVVDAVDAYPRENHFSIRVLFAGRLVDQKRPHLFIELASRLRSLLPCVEIEFVIAGDGPLRQGLEAMAEAEALQGRVKFLGELEDITMAYRDSDVLILTSSHEGTPNVILEAMAHGVPVLATRVGGVPEIVPEGCGILVDPNDFEELVRAAVVMVRDEGLRVRLGERARTHVRNQHSIDYLSKTLMEIYSKVRRRGAKG